MTRPNVQGPSLRLLAPAAGMDAKVLRRAALTIVRHEPDDRERCRELLEMLGLTDTRPVRRSS